MMKSMKPALCKIFSAIGVQGVTHWCKAKGIVLKEGEYNDWIRRGLISIYEEGKKEEKRREN